MLKFNVGDKVADGYEIGTIVKITPKRRDITVDFGNYKREYDKTGWRRGESWHRTYIMPLTEEKMKEIKEHHVKIKAVILCRKVTEDSVTYDKAVKIIEILGANGGELNE